MSSYKPHLLASILMGIPFAPSIFYLFFTLFGVSIPDLDHNVNKYKLRAMFIIGVVISVVLYLIRSNFLSGLLLVSMAVVFYFSHHRGFTHSIIGTIILSAMFLFIIMSFLPVLTYLGLSNNICIFIVMALVGYLLINRRFVLFYLTILAIYLLISPLDYLSLNWGTVFLMIFIGAYSHMFLDLLTPQGLNVFWPISFKCHKEWGVLFFIFWLISSIYVLYLKFWYFIK